MRELFLILIVMAVLLGLTLIRYRKQIAGMIGLARTLKELRDGSVVPGNAAKGRSQPVALVNCAKCGVWVPQDRALSTKNLYFCSDACRKTPVVT